MPEAKEENGVAAILRTAARYPMAAVQIAAFFGGMYAMYYALQGEIKESRAEQTQKYAELSTKLLNLVSSDLEERQRIETVYNRGDVRYQEIKGVQSQQNIELAQISADLKWIVRRLDNGTNH